MKLYNYPGAKQVIVSGDIHGDFKMLVFNLCIRYGCTDTLLIVAGDCGFGFEKQGYYENVYNIVVGRLRKANNWVAFVRGNHDDPAYFAEEKINHARFKTVPDYCVISAGGHQLLCVGGATSIDRSWRKKQNARLRVKTCSCYWLDEAPVFKPEEIESIPEEIRIDTVVTHTAPSFCELNMHVGLGSWVQEDPSLIDDVVAERLTMDQIYQHLKLQCHPLQNWFYGHFHQSWNGLIDGVQFSMLDIMEFKEIAPNSASPVILQSGQNK